MNESTNLLKALHTEGVKFSSEVPAAALKSSAPQTVVIVSGDVMCAKVIDFILTSNNYLTKRFNSETDALLWFIEGNNADLIIVDTDETTDLAEKGSSEHQVLQRALTGNSVVYLTSSSPFEIAKKFLGKVYNDYLYKPIRREWMLGVVESNLVAGVKVKLS